MGLGELLAGIFRSKRKEIRPTDEVEDKKVSLNPECPTERVYRGSSIVSPRGASLTFLDQESAEGALHYRAPNWRYEFDN